MLGSHQTRNLSDVFPSQLRDRYVQLSPAVSCQLSGGGAAAVRPQRSTSPAPTSRPAKQPGSESESYSRLPTINYRLQVLRSPCGQLPQLFHSPLPSTT